MSYRRPIPRLYSNIVQKRVKQDQDVKKIKGELVPWPRVAAGPWSQVALNGSMNHPEIYRESPMMLKVQK